MEVRPLQARHPLRPGQGDPGDAQGVLAHEVRNMLGAMRDSVELLKRASLDADGQRALEAIERLSGRILQLIKPME